MAGKNEGQVDNGHHHFRVFLLVVSGMRVETNECFEVRKAIAP